MEEVILTEEEEKLTRYCEDFCPISNAITEYNKFHRALFVVLLKCVKGLQKHMC